MATRSCKQVGRTKDVTKANKQVVNEWDGREHEKGGAIVWERRHCILLHNWKLEFSLPLASGAGIVPLFKLTSVQSVA